MIRMEDKWNRLDNLVRGENQMVSEESIRDTLLNLAGYCIMTTMEIDRRNSSENQKIIEAQVQDSCVDDGLEQESTQEIVEKAVLHDDEKGDIEVNIPEKLEKKPVDEGKVIALHKAKWSQKKIADEMGCSQGRISQIIKSHKGE